MIRLYCVHHIFLLPPSIHGCLGCFRVLAPDRIPVDVHRPPVIALCTRGPVGVQFWSLGPFVLISVGPQPSCDVVADCVALEVIRSCFGGLCELY